MRFQSPDHKGIVHSSIVLPDRGECGGAIDESAGSLSMKIVAIMRWVALSMLCFLLALDGALAASAQSMLDLVRLD